MAEEPDVAAAYSALREACDRVGPLSDDVVALIKLAVSVGGGKSRTLYAHTRKALRAGADPAALRQVAFIALPTIGLPSALEALDCIERSIEEMADQPTTNK